MQMSDGGLRTVTLLPCDPGYVVLPKSCSEMLGTCTYMYMHMCTAAYASPPLHQSQPD